MKPIGSRSTTLVLFAVLLLLMLLSCSTGPSCSEIASKLEKMNEEQDWGDKVETTELCRKAMEQCPDLAIAHEATGWMTLEGGNAGVAFGFLMKALKLEPDNGRLLEWLQSEPTFSGHQLILVNENREVEIIPLKEATLGHYARLSSGGRYMLCERLVEIYQSSIKDKNTRLVNQGGQQIGVMKYTMQVSTPEQLDARLQQKAVTDPGKELGDEVFLVMAGGLSQSFEFTK